MSVFIRSLIAAATGVILVGVTSCSGGDISGGDEVSPSTAAGSTLSGFDPCTFFKSEELKSWELSTQSEDFSPVSYEPGCSWDGELMGLTLQKNAEETEASYGETGSFDRYESIQIGNRSAARALSAGEEGQGGCSTFVDAGGGVVIYGVSGHMRDSVPDPCAEVEKIAGQTVSRLPK